MIKAIALDVDGVLLGTIPNKNIPYPSDMVSSYLFELNKRLPISLISGKGSFGIMKVLGKLKLESIHVSDAGAVVLDYSSESVLSQKLVRVDTIKEMMTKFTNKELIWELYDTKGWYVQKGINPEFIERHRQSSVIIQPTIHNSLIERVEDYDGFTKVMICYLPEQEEYVREIFDDYRDKFSMQWAGAPAIEPYKVLFITNKEASKKSAIKLVASHYEISTQEILGVGDTLMDWEFLEECGYIGIMGNAKPDLVEIVNTNPKAVSFRGGDVDEDGLIDILEHFRDEMVLDY
jgi:HAD superfamily hydrolase (TIGR01484 family)